MALRTGYAQEFLRCCWPYFALAIWLCVRGTCTRVEQNESEVIEFGLLPRPGVAYKGAVVLDQQLAVRLALHFALPTCVLVVTMD